MIQSLLMMAKKIVMNFANESLRNEAAQKLENVEKLTTKSVQKIKPKIMLCNVHKEETKEGIIDTIIARNDYLQAVPDIKSKIENIFCKPAAGGTVHYIMKCDPMIRQLLHQHQDRIKLEWGVYQVRDRYHALICYHCQRYGHTEANCNAKKNGEHPVCFKCAGNHKSKDCTSTEKKCINCVRFKKQNTDHSANNSCCIVLESEIDRIRNITDHGY